MHEQIENETRPIVIRGWIVPYASLIHLIWAVVLLFEPMAINIAPIFQMSKLFGDNHYLIAALFFGVGALAWCGGILHRATLTGVVMGVPQLILITFSAGSCIEVIIAGTHPDGTVDGHLFFVAQLAPSILLAPVYFLAIYQPYWKALWKLYRS